MLVISAARANDGDWGEIPVLQPVRMARGHVIVQKQFTEKTEDREFVMRSEQVCDKTFETPVYDLTDNRPTYRFEPYGVNCKSLAGGYAANIFLQTSISIHRNEFMKGEGVRDYKTFNGYLSVGNADGVIGIPDVQPLLPLTIATYDMNSKQWMASFFPITSSCFENADHKEECKILPESFSAQVVIEE